MQFDVWENDWRKITLGKPNVDCKTCGRGEYEFLEAGNQDFFTNLCGRDAVQIQPLNSTIIDLEKMAKKFEKLGDIKLNEYLLRLKIEGFEITLFKDARAIIKGTDDKKYGPVCLCKIHWNLTLDNDHFPAILKIIKIQMAM